MKSKFAIILDYLFFGVVIWLFSAIVILYFIDDLLTVAAMSTVISVGIGFLIRIKSNNTKEIKIDNFKAQAIEHHFLFNDDEYALEYFYQTLKKRYNVSKLENYLQINQTIVIPYLTEPLPLKKAVQFYCHAKKKNAKCLIILTFKTEKFPINLNKKFTDIRFEIFDATKTYQLLKSLNSLPKEEQIPKGEKVKQFISQAFLPSKAKSYLFSAFIMLFGAYFSIFSIYFIVMAAICITLAIVCKLNIAKKFT